MTTIINHSSEPRFDAEYAPAGQVIVTAGRGRFTIRFAKRTAVVSGLMVALAIALLFTQLLIGDVWLSPGQVWDALWGGGGALGTFSVVDVRLPRALAALMVGAAFGASGAIFQNVSRNALASPDIMGFTSGAAVGAVFMILVVDAGQTDIVLGAVVGGLVTAVLVYGLGYQRGNRGGYRLILIGIGLSAIFVSLTAYMILKADLENAASAYQWLVGSLYGTTWVHVIGLAICLVVLTPAAAALAGPMRLLEMGPDVAAALGLGVGRITGGLLLVGTLLAAGGVAVAGPVAFIALSAPQIARRVVRGASPGLFSSALMGAVLLAGSDLVAQRAVPNNALPVGVATVLLGGGYLVWLLIREQRASRV